MKTMTAQDVLNSQVFYLAATQDALRAVAEQSGQALEETLQAYKHRRPAVYDKVEHLVLQAAREFADALNAALAL